jgi:hypothetical protein
MREFNACHAPQDGKFCSGSSGVNSAAFKAWFGRSTVVNADGTPKRMYHSGGHDVEEFRPFSHFGTAKAASDRFDSLHGFSVDVVGRKPEATRTYAVYLKIENPLRLPDLADIYYDTERDQDLDDEPTPEQLEDGSVRARSWESETDLATVLYSRDVISRDEFWDVQYSPTDAMKLLRKKGYDGIVYKNAVEDPGNDSYIVFSPRQIKSATGNRGTYSRRRKITEFNPCHSPEDGKFCSGSKGAASSPEFQQWFKGSKVVDSAGRPLLVYHGGRAGLTEFRIKNDRYKTGMFFSSSVKTAESFAKWNNGEVYPVYLRIRKPFIVDAKGESYFDIPMPRAMRRDWVGDKVDTDGIASWALKHGYDGAIIRNVFEGTLNTSMGDNYVVFSPKQIKRAGSKSLREFNACHAPDDGKFCSGGDGAGRSTYTLQPGKPLYHGTIEPFEGEELRPGGDGLAWFADKSGIARNYIPNSGGKVLLSVPEDARMLSPGNPRPDETRLEFIRAMGYEAHIETDARGEIRSWRYTKIGGDGKGVRLTGKDLREYIEKEYGYKPQGKFNPYFEMRVHDGRTLKAGEQIEGRLFTIEATRPLKLYDMTGSEGDLTDPQHLRYTAFKRLEKQGYDGVRINDFGQSEHHGNYGHVSYGLFPRGLKKIRVRKVKKSTRADSADFSFVDAE